MLIKRKAKRFEDKVKAQAASDIEPITKGFGFEMPPAQKLVDIYFDQKGFPSQAVLFYDFYNRMNWGSPKGTPFRNWKLLAGDWIFNYQQELKLKKRLRINGLLY